MEREYHVHYESEALRDLANGEAGAEFHLLEILRSGVQCGFPMSVDFQNAVNLIVAKSMLVGKWPAPRKGRPKQNKPGKVGLEVATQYARMIEDGQGYQRAVSELSVTFHKDERQIMRIVKENKHAVKVMNAYRATFKVFGFSQAEIDRMLSAITGVGGKQVDPAVQHQELLSDLQRRLNEILMSRVSTDRN